MKGLAYLSSRRLNIPCSSPLAKRGKIQAGLSSYLGKLTILVATPVRLQDNIVGFLVGAYLLDDEFALYVKQMGGVEVAFFGKQGVVGASHPDFKAWTCRSKKAKSCSTKSHTCRSRGI